MARQYNEPLSYRDPVTEDNSRDVAGNWGLNEAMNLGLIGSPSMVPPERATTVAERLRDELEANRGRSKYT